MFQAVADGRIGELVQLLDLLPLDIGFSGQPQDVRQAGLVDLAVDDLARQGDLRQKAREHALGPGEARLLFRDAALQRHAEISGHKILRLPDPRRF